MTDGRADEEASAELKRPCEITLRYRPAGPRHPGLALRFVPDADKSCAALRRK